MKAIRDGLGGVILFDQDLQAKSVRNIQSPQQVAALVKALKGHLSWSAHRLH